MAGSISISLLTADERGKSMIEAQIKSVTLLLDGVGLLITDILVLFAKDLEILFAGKREAGE
jgi:hypothetical protein